MESFGAMGCGDWSSFNAIYSSTTEEADFMVRLLGNISLPNDVPNSSNVKFSSTYWPASESDVNKAVVQEDSSINSSDDTSVDADVCYSFSQGSSFSGEGSSILCPLSQIYFCNSNSIISQPIVTRNDSSVCADYAMMECKNKMDSCDHEIIRINNILMEEGRDFLNQDVSSDCSMESGENDMPEAFSRGMILQQGKDQHEINSLASEKSLEDESDNLLESSKKRPSTPLDVHKNKRMINAKTNHQKLHPYDSKIAEGGHPVLCRQSSSSYLSEDDSNVSFNLHGKTRASRGSATDHHSLYARKRREKINERLRILQKLIPNGTKVDISTMLEEAVQYVKFLQLQIKLLSSDDLWMYAPIAYNGKNLGLDMDATLKS
ncbi:transcription factor bHLH54-like [Coffea eugenioides]|uniref:transcription factor bHLH54-like n=1 Tax=Coffea eugenioides TaxID=49369 RepID=UPI000F611F57|nr:transcription factor bHLH54-like [Coffea eugenioides]